MTRFYNYLNEESKLERWEEYVDSNPMLHAAVEILEKINSKGYKAYIVGGGVRDIVLGDKMKDVDIATNMPMDEIYDTFTKVFDIGKSKTFGIVVVNYGGYDFEVAQFRTDGEYLDGRRPEDVEIVMDFETDAGRRDFTINAMGIDAQGNIIDYFDGKKDIKHKIIRTVGNPYDRFEEDYLRMKRAIRFSSKLSFEIDQETLDAIKSKKDFISKIAPERIREELVKMAGQSGEKFARAISLLDETGILDIILPEITKLKEFYEQPEFHPEAYEQGEGRVFDHVLAALRKNDLEDPIVNLAILMHDVGKGVTFKKRDGKNTFHGHAEASKEIIDNIADRLKLSNKEKQSILFAALNHMKMTKALDMKPTKIMKLVDDENWEVLKAVSYCDDACRTGLFDKKRFNHIISNMEKIHKRWGDKTTGKVAKIVDGQRVMDITGLRPGKQVGDIIKMVTDWVVNKGSKESIDSLIKKAYQQLS